MEQVALVNIARHVLTASLDAPTEFEMHGKTVLMTSLTINKIPVMAPKSVLEHRMIKDYIKSGLLVVSDKALKNMLPNQNNKNETRVSQGQARIVKNDKSNGNKVQEKKQNGDKPLTNGEKPVVNGNNSTIPKKIN